MTSTGFTAEELGTIKTWITDRGFGFIAPDRAGPDFFCHITVVKDIDPDDLRPGLRVSFALAEVEHGRNRGRTEAVRVARA